MDKMLYIAASGASQDLLGTAVRSNNLANAQTTGFKAMLTQARAMPAFGDGLPTRVFAMTESHATKMSSGPTVQTERAMDLAIQGDGWFAVQDKNGNEAYTRAGSMQAGPDGLLKDAHGNPLVGEGGPIFLPLPVENITFTNDGTITVRPQGAPANVQEEIGRLKLVNPDTKQLARGDDGLFRQKDGNDADLDPNVRIRSGALESSNVNPIDEMMTVIGLQRHYEMQVKLMKEADELSVRGNQMLRII
ncbi:flagellar basal-body rod protein FlgF [Alteromonas sp. a30]|uniref:flagellar basal-body rod protein FlgF n=1 Tax=Alteromonas sp. a30 TaxID=2730917 RepID=UPI002282701A|nr:flagellar basal-body rod protein FlgF [Alteromonas sp. a30]MCY7294548.1 flagellar basal-body rod protein FlgF [Alteromonas sp. a30]